MKLFRLGAGAFLSLVLLTSWMGACSSTDNEPCGIDGQKNGICTSGTTCSAGNTEIQISDPADQCPGSNRSGGTNYICCAPTTTATSGAGSTTTTTTSATSSSSTASSPVDAASGG